MAMMPPEGYKGPDGQPWESTQVAAGEDPEERFLFAKMKLANRGDAKAFVRDFCEAGGKITADMVQCFSFQTALALSLAAAEPYFVKHNDIKPENIFVCAIKAPNGLSLVCHLGRLHELGARGKFTVHMRSGQAYIFMLGDFGHADDNSMKDGKPITVNHFPSIQSIPPEIAFLGGKAKQGHPLDVCCLGLCILQFAMGATLDEVMRGVIPPDELMTAWKEIWQRDGSIFRQRPEGDVDYDELCHVLYWYFVIFYVDKMEYVNHASRIFRSEPWMVAYDMLLSENGTSPFRKGFVDHCKLYSLAKGTKRHMIQARAALGKLGLDLVRMMCKFDPTERMVKQDILHHEYFDCFHVSQGAPIGGVGDQAPRPKTIKYTFIPPL